tara:strand:+ start:293 stop:631 length:339 start_codon:yes stop_codon:yes gene_type:complete
MKTGSKAIRRNVIENLVFKYLNKFKKQYTKNGNKIKSVLPAPIGYRFIKLRKLRISTGRIVIQKMILLCLNINNTPMKIIDDSNGKKPRSLKFLINIRLLKKSFTKLAELFS